MKQQKHHNQKKIYEAGQGFVEYAIILIFVGIAVVLVVSLMQPAIGDVFSRFVAQAPVAPPSLLNYTPPPTFTNTPTVDPSASATTVSSNPTNTATATATSTATATPTATNTLAASATPPCPYGPFTASASGSVRIQMEDFRCGGAGVAFNDTTGDGPGSGTYRSDVGDEGPDLENTSDSGGGINVGWTQNDEWMEYEIIAPVTDSYLFTIRHASPSGNNPRIQIHTTSVDNGYQADTNTISVGTTGGWQNWQSRSVQVTLFEGRNIVRFNIVTGSGNYNYFDIAPFAPTATPTPVPPTATPTPDLTVLELYLEAESGNGLTGSWVIANSGSASGGQYIYWSGSDRTNSPHPNNQVTYSFNAPVAGLYKVYLRVNTRNSTNDDSVWVTIDGVNVNQSINISRSDGWVMFNNIAGSTSWLWDQVHNAESGNALVEFYVPSAGTRTLRLTYRENNTWIDQIYITNSSTPP